MVWPLRPFAQTSLKGHGAVYCRGILCVVSIGWRAACNREVRHRRARASIAKTCMRSLFDHIRSHAYSISWLCQLMRPFRTDWPEAESMPQWCGVVAQPGSKWCRVSSARTVAIQRHGVSEIEMCSAIVEDTVDDEPIARFCLFSWFRAARAQSRIHAILEPSLKTAIREK